jgi:hypothetical protein
MGHNRRRFNQLVRLARPATGLGHVGRGAILHRTVQIEGTDPQSASERRPTPSGVQIVARSGKSSVSIAQSCKIHTYAILDAKGGNIDIGDHSTVGSFSVLYGHGGLTIGERVSIAAHCSVVAANHIFTDPDTPFSFRETIPRASEWVPTSDWHRRAHSGRRISRRRCGHRCRSGCHCGRSALYGRRWCAGKGHRPALTFSDVVHRLRIRCGVDLGRQRRWRRSYAGTCWLTPLLVGNDMIDDTRMGRSSSLLVVVDVSSRSTRQ